MAHARGCVGKQGAQPAVLPSRARLLLRTAGLLDCLQAKTIAEQLLRTAAEQQAVVGLEGSLAGSFNRSAQK
jgi:hypothetical protein